MYLYTRPFLTRFAVVALALAAIVLPLGGVRAWGASLLASGYWHTQGTSIVTASGHQIRIAGVTWYGMESTRWVPAGLDDQPQGIAGPYLEPGRQSEATARSRIDPEREKHGKGPGPA